MNTSATVSKENIQEQLLTFKSKANYIELAELLAFSLKNASSELNRDVFGYIPSLFREIAIADLNRITPSLISINEPVIYRINFPKEQIIRGIPYFYLFCYLKQHSSELNVYFQSATRTSRNFSQTQYKIAHKKIKFEGIISAFKDSESAICISDPGHFIPDLISSFYIGSRQINFPELISNTIESICVSAGIKLEDTFLFGSSAGGMGALLSSTYFSSKVQVMAVNAQIITYDLRRVMNKLLGTEERDVLLKKFANRVSCLNRFQQNINSVPNIYLLANVNDSLHHRNYKFYQLYQDLFVAKGKDNQSIFDSYSGIEGHGRPDKVSLKRKIDMAKESLTMKANCLKPKYKNQLASEAIKFNSTLKSNLSEQKFSSIAKFDINSLRNKNFNITQGNNLNLAAERKKREYFDSYISLGDNCEAGLQFRRIGYKESSFFRFTSSNFATTFNIIKNDFKKVFAREYIMPRPKCSKMVLNTKYNIAFHSKLTSTISSEGQEFSQSYDFDEVFQHETNKINYLISKWNQMMNSERHILFILKNDSPKKYLNEEKVSKLAELFLDKYKNHNFQILCLQLDKFSEPQWKNPYLINRYFPFFAPRTSAGKSYNAGWNKVFEDFPLSNNDDSELKTVKNDSSEQKIIEYKIKLQQAEDLFQQDIQQSKTSISEVQYPTVGDISDDGVAIAGKQNWLYINSGSNSLMKYHTGTNQLTLPQIKRWSELLHQRIVWHQEHKIQYQHLFVPNKIAIYPEYYPHPINIKGDRPIIQLQQECEELFLYPLNLFLEQKNNYLLYNKHDCHWNFWGCYFAYSSVCQLLRITPNVELFNSSLKIVRKRGDLGGKYGVTERVLCPDLKLNSKIIRDNQVINFSHQGSIRVLKNNSIPDGKIIIFGDSFCNPGFPDYSLRKRLFARLATLFAETLNEVHFVWTPWIDYDYIEREKPDFVLTEMAERFLVRVPDDCDRLPLEEFATMKFNEAKSKRK